MYLKSGKEKYGNITMNLSPHCKLNSQIVIAQLLACSFEKTEVLHPELVSAVPMCGIDNSIGQAWLINRMSEFKFLEEEAQ